MPQKLSSSEEEDIESRAKRPRSRQQSSTQQSSEEPPRRTHQQSEASAVTSRSAVLLPNVPPFPGELAPLSEESSTVESAMAPAVLPNFQDGRTSATDSNAGKFTSALPFQIPYTAFSLLPLLNIWEHFPSHEG